MSGWHDMAGALSYRGTHHVWQGCPLAPGGGGWHHSASEDLVHWEDRGVDIKAMNETHAGMVSDSVPCSGFVTVDDTGVPCAGFRQQTATHGVDGGKPWDVPLELRCALNDKLTQWSGPIWLYDVFYYRFLPYDPVRPWVDTDGLWYSTISTDGCNATNSTSLPAAHRAAKGAAKGAAAAAARSHAAADRTPGEQADAGGGSKSGSIYCKEGGRLDLWRSPALRGNASNWTYVGPMFTTARSSQGNQITKEFVTTGYFGFGDGGATRVVTQNAKGANYWIGTQSNGSNFTVDWTDFGSTGYYDYGSLTMARTLGGDPNQVAKPGRRTLVGWIGTKNVEKPGPASQSLARDLTLFEGGQPASKVLLQQFVPELQGLRVPGSVVRLGGGTGRTVGTGWLRTEVVASFTVPNTGPDGRPFAGRFGVRVLGSKNGKSSLDATVDCSERVAGNVQASTEKLFCVATCREPSKLFPAPLLPLVAAAPPSPNSTTTEVRLHAIIDHSILECIFNNRTAMAVAGVGGKNEDDTDLGIFGVASDPAAVDGGRGVSGSLMAWQLSAAN